MPVDFDDAMDVAELALEAAPELIDVYLLLFLQQRMLRSGLNTVTRSGHTSPGSGLLVNWPGWGPDGMDPIQGNPGGTVTSLQQEIQSLGNQLTQALQSDEKTIVSDLTAAANAVLGFFKSLGL